ncbi:MAG: PQQ-binding-like beta-propeller repeat protein [Armatimonadetes bacterium]|nr:PQQ-binding-like beta-propeller repeat protein [Armatimonadota bacterium]
MQTWSDAGWHTLRGDVRHTGYTPTKIEPPFRLAWARYFEGERLGTAMEPIVAEGKVFIATHGGKVFALRAETGEPLWYFQAMGAFLHSPAYSKGLVVAADAVGSVYALDAQDGRMRWSAPSGRGGCSASPVVQEGQVFIGTRGGEMLSLDSQTGRARWRKQVGAPVRQTAAVSGGRVYVTAEDLRVRCYEASSGKAVWTSEPLWGQTARDYYPVIASRGGKTYVIVRTNPLHKMADHIFRDMQLLCQNAGIEPNWQAVERWQQSDRAMGTPELWRRECDVIRDYLRKTPDAQTFYVLDADTGRFLPPMPVLFAGGCQGVGTPPVVLPDGRLLVLYRSAYGNWTLGVAPLVAIGILNVEEGQITPLHHREGKQPPWNTFWGTADESNQLVVAGETLLLVHQGTVGAFRMGRGELFPVWGERDTWGGFRSLPWARNEWHGPARGGVAVVGARLYWLTGSRLLCIECGREGQAAADKPVDAKGLKRTGSLTPPAPPKQQLQQQLERSVSELLSKRWMPYMVEPGLAGREFAFAHSGEVFEALAWAFPHLSAPLRSQVKEYLAKEWTAHLPCTAQTFYSLREGAPRELVRVPADMRAPARGDIPQPHPFGNLYAVWLWATRCGERERVRGVWQQVAQCAEQFEATGWRLDGKRGDLFANRYLASWYALQQLATQLGERSWAERAAAQYQRTLDALVEWWKVAAGEADLPTFYKDIARWDEFIGKGDRLFLVVFDHRAHVALFADLTPEVGRAVRERAAEAVERVWKTFEQMCATWHLAGEERQVHYGENFVDLPCFSVDVFRAYKWLAGAKGEELRLRVDLPLCRADVGHILKLALSLEA